MRTRSQNSKKEKTAINSLPDEVNQISLLNHKRYRSNKRNIKANHIPKQTTNKRQFLLYKNITSLSYWKNNTTVGSGLKNVGNTCYINSVLQCLLYIPPLKNFLDYTEHSYHCHIKGLCFICEYCKLSKQTQANKGVSSGIIPYNILKNISYIASNFTLGSQEDAHEFLLYFITCLEISYMKYSNQILRKRNDDQVTKLLPNGYNIIQGIFGGKIISSVTCGRCKTVSSKIDNFSDISLDIANNDNLLTCFDNFCEVEKLTGDNKYYCEKCKRKCNAQKQFLFKECKYITNIIQYSSSNPNSSFKAI